MSKFKNLEQAQEAYDKLSEAFAALESKHAAAVSENEKLSADNSQKAADLKEQAEIIRDIRNKSVASGTTPSFEVKEEGKTEIYDIVGGKFRHAGKVITASEIVASKDLQKELLKLVAGYLVKRQQPVADAE